MKDQLVGAGCELRGGQDVFIGAPIVVGDECFEACAGIAIDNEEVDLDALCGASARGVQNMCCQVSGHDGVSVLVWGGFVRGCAGLQQEALSHIF